MKAVTIRPELLACVVHLGCRLVPPVTRETGGDLTGTTIALHGGQQPMTEHALRTLRKAAELEGWEIEVTTTVLRYRRGDSAWSEVPLVRGAIGAVVKVKGYKAYWSVPPTPWWTGRTDEPSWIVDEVLDVSPAIYCRGEPGLWDVPAPVEDLVLEARRTPGRVRRWVAVSVPCPVCEAGVHAYTFSELGAAEDIDAPPSLSVSDYWLCDDDGHSGNVVAGGGGTYLGEPVGQGRKTFTREQIEETASRADAGGIRIALERESWPLRGVAGMRAR